MLKEIMGIKSNDGERREEDGKGGVLGSDKRKNKKIEKKINRNEEKIAFEFDSKNISMIIVSKYFIKNFSKMSTKGCS